MVDLESLAGNEELIYDLSSVILLLGLFFLAFPLLLRLIYTKKIQAFDFKTILFVRILLTIIIAATQLVSYSSRNPEVLLPFVMLSCGLKFGSPAMMAHKMKQKETDPGKWEQKKQLLLLAALVAGLYTMITTLTNQKTVTVVETLMTTFASAYSFSRIYLDILLKYTKVKGKWFNLLAGLFIGISFIVLVPFLVPEFLLYYELSGGLGWLGAFTFLFFTGPIKTPEVQEQDGEGTAGTGEAAEAGENETHRETISPTQGKESQKAPLFTRKKLQESGEEKGQENTLGFSRRKLEKTAKQQTSLFNRKKL